MNYGKINKNDTANGPGVRVSFWVSGCRNNCPGCFNQETHDFGYGQPYDSKVFDELVKALEPEWIDGLSILGGEPLDPRNYTDVLTLCFSIKMLYSGMKDIWLYTGSVLDIEDIRVLGQYGMDVVVDGPFMESKRDMRLAFRGSSNQRIIDVKKSAEKGEIIEYELK